MRSIFKGSLVALVTPFAEDGSVDHDTIRGTGRMAYSIRD